MLIRKVTVSHGRINVVLFLFSPVRSKPSTATSFIKEKIKMLYSILDSGKNRMSERWILISVDCFGLYMSKMLWMIQSVEKSKLKVATAKAAHLLRSDQKRQSL